MPGKAARITITESQQEILRSFSRSTTAPSRLRQRASIILMAFDGLLNEDIARAGRPGPPPGGTLATTLGQRLGTN